MRGERGKTRHIINVSDQTEGEREVEVLIPNKPPEKLTQNQFIKK